MKRQINADHLRVSMAVLVTTTGCGSIDPTDPPLHRPQASASVGEVRAEILNGTVPEPGGLAPYGVVKVSGGCTGTLLTNQHVLTAHHCTRGLNKDNTWAADANTGMTVRFEEPSGTTTRSEQRIFEDAQPWGTNPRDYSIIELSEPMPVAGITDHFYQAIYNGPDSALQGINVLCIGYGDTRAATPTKFAGGVQLTSAWMTISSVGSGTFFRPANSSGQVGFGGDSGSSCFLAGTVVGVESTCNATGFVDINRNGINEMWAEVTGSSGCTSSSPDRHRPWVLSQILADVSISYAFVPAMPPSTAVEVIVSTSAGDETVAVVGTWSEAQAAPRSGHFEVKLTSWPPGMMCPVFPGITTPLDGSVNLSGTCLDNGLVSVMLDTA